MLPPRTKARTRRARALISTLLLMETPDTITAVVTRREEIAADKVDLYVTIVGSSLITGNAALKKAKEVSQLVLALAPVGVKEAQVVLQGIHAESSSGILGKSTSASYQLRVTCLDLERLAEILGVVTSQKNVKLDLLDWCYPDDKELKIAWLQGCLREAREKANAISSSLGVKLIGVHSLSEKWVDPESGGPISLRQPAAAGVFLKARRAERIDLGFPLSHSKWVELQLECRFRVSEISAQPA
jgi:uncharacterized protein YggE